MNVASAIHDAEIKDLINVLRYESGFSQRIIAHLRGLEKDLLGAYINAGDITSQRRLNALLSECRAAIADRYEAAQGLHDTEMPQFASIQAEKAISVLNGAVKVDIFRMSMTSVQADAIASNVMIEGAPSAEWWGLQEADTLRKFTNAVRGGMLRGATGDEMAREIRDLMGVSMRNAQALVRTSVITTNNAAHMAAYDQNADLMAGYQWMATLDPSTCSRCGNLDGKVWKWGESHPSPSLHWNCLVPGTKVLAPNILRGFERPYSGDVIVIRTAGGNEITCTPNHPILTARGWVAAGELNEGDEVIKSLERDWALGTTPNGVEVETSIEDVVGSLLASRGMIPEFVPLTTEDFHGDALHHEVATVWANRKLGDSGHASSLEHLEELSLVDGASGGNSSLTCKSCQGLLEGGLDTPLRRLMCILREAQSLVLGRLGHPGEHALTSIPGGDASLVKPKHDRPSSNPEMVSDSLHARARVVESDHLNGVDRDSLGESEPSVVQRGVYGLPVDPKRPEYFGSTHASLEGGNNQRLVYAPVPDLDASIDQNSSDAESTDAEIAFNLIHGNTIGVSLDKCANIRRIHFDGHVYNLETEGNWYVANGIITHNCRCMLLPKTKSWEQLAKEAGGNTDLAKKLDQMDPGTRASMDGQVAAGTTYQDWLKGKSETEQRAILGDKRFDIMQAGKLSLSDLVNQNGRELTLGQLVAL